MSEWTCVRTGDDELQHHGIKGQKWGVRRFQKKDGSLTPAGKKRYDDSDETREQKEEKAKSRKRNAKVAAAVVTTAAVTTAAITNKDQIKKGMDALKTKKTSDEGEKKEASVEDYKSGLKKAQSTEKALSGIREFVNKADNEAYRKKVKVDLSQMSDKELQQAVNRLNMEERYSQVMQQRHVLDRGESKVNKILDVAGDVVSGAVTALTIAVAIKELTKK